MKTSKSKSARNFLHWFAFALLLVGAQQCCSVRAQFLFTYEINQESDDSRAPKSSLFDPSSFRIVTPSQLQNTYQKLSSAPPSGPSGLPVPAEPVAAPLPAPQQPSASAQQAPSLLKQTSAALQSFAELFSLSSPSSSSSPSPLQALQPAVNQATAAATSSNQPSQASNGLVVDQQAEARSLHEHWTQQQQNSHLQASANSEHQFNQLQTHPAASSGQTGSQTSQPSIATAALNSFTTSQPTGAQQGQQQASQASYWLTANPLSGPDGNYLVQIQNKHQQPQQVSSPASIALDNLLTVSSPRSSPLNPGQLNQAPRTAKLATSAQASFLSTPTSYYPAPAQVESSTRTNEHHFGSSQHQHQHQHQHQQQPHQHQPRAVPGFAQTPSTAQQASLHRDLLPEVPQQLQPPANIPENFIHAQPEVAHHKSAEESLISFRQQQRDQHEQQNALFGAQQQLAAQHKQQQQLPRFQQPTSGSVQQQPKQQQHFQQALSEPANQPQAHHQLGEIPKVSPQIYESFLLQQKDQHEKHMELLKQQQELNKLLEQKHKQQEAELKRKRKKEELDKEARKKALREQEAARKLKLEQEEAQKRRARQEEEERKQRQLAAEQQQRRYREYLESKEREKREKEQRELAALKQRQRLAEEEEAKLRLEREREKEQAAELAERRRQAELADSNRQRQRPKENEDVKYVNYLRQQEELRKLLELKQKEDEAIQARRKLAALQQARAVMRGRLAAPSGERADTGGSSNSSSGTTSVRTSSSWGTPIRSRAAGQQPQEPSTASSLTSSTQTATTQVPLSTGSGRPAESETEVAPTGSSTRRPRGYLVKKQRTLDEKLIRQKIPLYSGPGQYGLYRGLGNESSIANDVAALLESVVLPSSTTTTSTSTSTTTPAPDLSVTSSFVLGGSDSSGTSSSLSPLLNTREFSTERASSSSLADQSTAGPVEPFFDDDVPRRPARGLTSTSQASSSKNNNLTSQLARQQQRALVAAASQRSLHRFNESSSSSGSPTRTAHIGLASLPADSDNDGIPGRAGVEYPVLAAVPPTSFSCSKQPLNGYYADTETACQVVHLCQAGVQSSILCPNGTIFNQEKFSCQWWYEVNCSRAPMFYQLNDNLYKSLPGNNFESEKKNKSGQRRTEKQTNLLASASAAS